MSGPLKIKERPSVERLRQIFTCDGEAGILRRIKPRKNASLGTVSSSGYRQSIVDGRLFHVPHIIWAMTTGKWPVDDLDHIDGCRTNDRMSNLREATRAQNCANQPVRKNNTSGFKGVSKHGRGWRFSVTHNGIRFISRVFARPEAAHAGYLERTSEINGGFARIDRTVSRAVFAPDNGS